MCDKELEAEGGILLNEHIQVLLHTTDNICSRTSLQALGAAPTPCCVWCPSPDENSAVYVKFKALMPLKDGSHHLMSLSRHHRLLSPALIMPMQNVNKAIGAILLGAQGL